MALQESGAISIADIAAEFEGTAPHSLSEYVSETADGSNPTSMSEFYGLAATGLQTILYNPSLYSTGSGDSFGKAVAINNTYCCVGAPAEDNADGTNAGALYIYNNSTGALLWSKPSPNIEGTSAGDLFGEWLDMSDNYIIAGAPGETVSGNIASGRAYIFNPATGALVRTLSNPNAYSTGFVDGFGRDVAISNSYAFVGARGEDYLGGGTVGITYVFSTSTWSLVSTIEHPNPDLSPTGDSFGGAIDIANTYSVVGLSAEYSGTTGGMAWIFNNATGAIARTISNPNGYSTGANDAFGSFVAMTDTYTAIAAIDEDDASGGASGKVYIFSTTGGNLLRTISNPNPTSTSSSDSFGEGLEIYGTTLIVSAPGEDTAANAAGNVYIFDATNGSLLHTFADENAYGTASLDYKGKGAVGVASGYAIVGASNEDDASGSASGAAYIYKI